MALFDKENSEEIEVVELMTPYTYSWKVEHFHELLQSKGLRQKPENEIAAIMAMREMEKNDFLNQRRKSRREKNEKLTLEEKTRRLEEVQQRRLERNATHKPEKDFFLKAKLEKEREERQRRRDNKEAIEASSAEAQRSAKQQQIMRMKAAQATRLTLQEIRLDDSDASLEPMPVHGSDEL
mmetsp:Transcript_90412/g.135526  ORF Transcript_90412/g.135526 Transcript_90412/m.135526 type:complete len:181 (-) Transcript_90412:79-621(-)